MHKNLAAVLGSLFGSRAARGHVRESQKQAADIEGRLAVMAERWPDQLGDSDARPVFVFAAGWRTGSTLLQRLLMSDNDIMIWGEPYNRSGLTATLMDQFRSITKDWPFEYYEGNKFEGDMSSQWVANIYPPIRHLIAAHRMFFSELFEAPALAMGKSRWGFKEVRLTSEHAIYLKFLYPKAKFVFLFRDPIKAYASFRGYIGFDYRAWPNKPVMTPIQFGEMWCQMVRDFFNNYERVGGMLIKYEELVRDARLVNELSEYVEAELKPIEKLDRISGRRKTGGHGERGGQKYIPILDRMLLNWTVSQLRGELGYDD